MKVLNNGLFILLLLFIGSCQKENNSNNDESEKGNYLSTILLDEYEHGESLNFENDYQDPNAIWNQFKNLFPNIQGPYPNPTQPLEQTYRVLNQTIEIKFYPEPNTTGSYTMSIRVRPNGLPFKIRFL
jgi:hypothetical protein